jgi:hypothetical protein
VHKHVFPKVSAAQREYLTRFFTVLFSDGFESGNFSAWTSTNGAPTVQSTTKYHGTYAMCINAAEDARKTLASAYSDVYLRGYVRFATLPAIGKSYRFFVIMASDWSEHVNVGIYTDGSGNSRWVMSTPGYSWEIVGDNVNANQWYCVEIRRKVGAGNGVSALWIDGANVFSASDDTIAVNAQVFIVGAIWANGGPTIDLYHDCIVIADAYIGPEATVKTVTDTLAFSDIVYRNKSLVIADTSGLTDVVLRNKTLAIPDSVGANDQVLGNKSPLIVADAVSLSELINVTAGVIVKTVIDAIGASDAALINKTAAITDCVQLLDEVFRHKSAVSVQDVVSVAEVILTTRLLAIGDSVSLADVGAVMKTLKVSDAVALVDFASTPSRILQTLDSLNLADNIIVNKVLQVTETINLVETVQVGVGSVKKTKLFLVIGDLAVQLTGE